MKSDDTDNYGTPFSYATDRENNEVVSKDILYPIVLLSQDVVK